MIPHGKQEITQQDIDAVLDVLQSDFLTQGPQVPKFEQSICEAVNAKYATAVNSATSALHIACLALGVGKGDVVWTSPISFVASSNCALYCGADIDFVDIDPVSYNMSVEQLALKLEHHKQNNLPLPKVVIPVHLCGQSCDMQTISQLSKEYGFSIIEDASHAIGGHYQDAPVGNCQYSDICIFSFHPVKIVTTAEGGVATTNNKSLSDKLNLLRSHGVTRSPDLMTEESHGPWYYQQVDLGFNYRMTEMQAALGVTQMSRLANFVERRNNLAARYDELLSELPLTLPKQADNVISARHLYIIRLNLSEINKTHKAVFEALRQAGIGVNLHYIPIHTQPYYQSLGFENKQLEQAELFYQSAIGIPLFHTMTDKQQDEVVQALKDITLCD